MQRLVIRFEHDEGAVETSYQQTDLETDELFWSWFVNIWDALGIPTIGQDLKKQENNDER